MTADVDVAINGYKACIFWKTVPMLECRSLCVVVW